MPQLRQQPRYLQLAQTLINEIEDGRYPIGTLLPTEFELCDQFGASRFTVREAIKRLVQSGMVSRQAGVGTRVLGLSRPAAYRQVMEGLSDLQQYTNETSLTIIARETIALDGPLSEQVGATSGQTWLHLMALRRAAGTSPISFSDIYLHPAFRSLKLDDDVGDMPIFSRIEEQFGERVAEVRQHIEAVAIPAPIAKLLETKTGAPGLRLTRQYLNARGEVVEMAINTHPADRYSYSQTFRRDPVSGL
ncbi:GntR family transcriptional regulator [Sphingomonas sp. CFBP 13714]|uniref:GntR family transcriptional regulator n=1 Tax=Sphingomonas sp. CFBP 13714 TaxID=2775308 RepID=UPI00178418BE|nr:GntR family transcriptional regulator [Sphingomonas sp. CFBP 13714]MBD8700676.1 GntR family transcriptional regulator [Sphingomonas sp. CFBP 13714]